MSEAVVLELIKTGATIATLIIGGIISVRMSKLHKQINSRMDQLIVETRSAAKAEGKVEEKAEERERNHPSGPTTAEAAKLKITGGEIKITGETKKKL